MTTDIDRKRNRLIKAYPGYSWHEKVAGMSNAQVIAVFLRFERDGWPKIEPKIDPKLPPVEEPKKEDKNDDQLGLF